MTVPPGYKSVTKIVLALLFLKSIRCMNGRTLLAGQSAEDAGKAPATSVYLDDVVKHERGFQGDVFMKKPSVSQADNQQYFKFMSQTTKPHPGLSLQHLDRIMGKAEIEAQGSSHGDSVNPYWPTLHMKFLAEDMDKITEDLDKLATAIGKRKVIGYSADSYEGGGQQKDTAKLAESARELQEANEHLEQYIERQFGHWAHEHDIRILDTFFEKNLSRKRKTSASQEIELKADSDTIKKLFSSTSSLKQVYETLSGEFRYLKPDTDQDFWALHRSYIQTLDQAYKHNLIKSKDFKELVKKRGYATAAARYMFLHFTHSEKGYKNPLYRNSDILLELSYASPFVNMLNVINRGEKTKFLHEILRLDAMEYAKIVYEGLAERSLADSFKYLFGSEALLQALEGTTSQASQVETHLKGIIKIFKDESIWQTEWRDSEAMRLMAQTLKFVDQNFLQEESPRLRIPSLLELFNGPLRNKLDLFSARAQAIVELEKLSKHLQGSFPLRSEGHPPKPISALEELELIDRKLEYLPAQEAYQSRMASTLKGESQTSCEKEIYGKIDALRDQIEKLRKQQSGASWLTSLFNQKFAKTT
ncbi:uncharacterized protein PGTG_12862 [Puccinia graminis f. sp. tritici CRL 75-36-700-3]|uniref:Uncharacterized protein n=1 Tax=Puccinia graminis f. sp. tritici (strain CRL 75-36-700-3 / race SCCL) TaxID=418459 RepID=E3KSJ2_PUCGT|nr:uncharacterized protein PGTG_12862 [Puccinia graminis f. sp. tritici CRL 75-36-700-3]EFP87278.2 hypothetical protein PGTG_12862 [Puccinia graminis f. sp. tritici CRL 75-36-700-3]